jgi:ribosomal protein S12 methylthiotransferase accessory factor YcaO
MRKFQRGAVVAAAIVGLSALGAGISFADGNDGAPVPVTAVANSSANAVAVGGGYYFQPQAAAPQEQAQPEAAPQEQAQPQEQGSNG